MKKDKRLHDKFDGIMFFSAELVGLILLVIFYPFATVTSEMITNKLIIDAPNAVTAGDTIKIKVTAGGDAVEGASISIIELIDDKTDINGTVNYTLSKTLKGVYNITATKFGYENATKTLQVSEYNKLEIQCLYDKSLIIPKIESRNIIIIIDASGSTLGTNTEPIVNETGYLIGMRETFSFIDLIKTNAINIVQNTYPLKNEYGSIVQDSYIGVVVFGSGSVSKTEILSMESKNNKSEFENFIRGISPKGIDYSADIDINNGLKMANEMMSNLTGTKEIIILSDGIYNKDHLDEIKNILVDLKNRHINIKFVQVLLSAEKDKNAIRPYAELAKAVNSNVIVLNPEERIGNFINMTRPRIFAEDKCLTRANDTIQIFVMSNLPIEGAEISYENNIIGTTNKSGILNYIFVDSGLFNLTVTKSGYENTTKIIEILPNQIPVKTVNPEPTYTKIIPEKIANNKVSGFKIIFGILMILIIYIRKK